MEPPRASVISSIFERADFWFLRARAALLGRIPCGKGCFHCCIGPFPITRLDAEALHRGIQRLPVAQRLKIEETALRQTAAMEAAYPCLADNPILDDWPDSKTDELIARFADWPCPALQQGSCAVYEFRPVTCRTMGIPTETDRMVNGACDVQTSIPVVHLPHSLRVEEDWLADQEARLLDTARKERSLEGDELLLPYGFLPESS